MAVGGSAQRTVQIEFVAVDRNVAGVVKEIGGHAADVRSRFAAAGKEAQEFGDAVRRSGGQAATGLGRVRTEAQAAQQNLKAAAKSGRAFIAGLKDVGLLGIGFSTIVDLGRQAVQVLDELATEALEVQQISRNLAFGIDEAAVATGGFVDNMTLARNANKAFALGVAEDATEFAALAGSAQKIAQAQGVSAQQLVEQAVLGIGRKSAARLDDLGITLNQAKAERVYAESLNKTAKELTVLEKEEAFQKAALIEIAKAGDRAATSIDGFAVTVAKGKIELTNAKQEMLGFDDTTGKVRESLRGLTDEQLDRLKFGEVADEASSAGRELNDVLSQWGVSLTDVRGVADELGVSFQELIAGQEELREVTAVEDTLKGLNALNEAAIKGLTEQADEAAFLSELGEAQGENQQVVNARLIESLELRRDAAELQFAQTQSTKDEAAILALTRKIQLAQASATKRGGGRGVSAEKRLLAIGEQRVAQLELLADLAEITATSAEDEAEARRASFEADRARLILEREALEATRARGRFARLELENKLAANAADQERLSTEQRIAEQQRLNELVTEAVSIETARSGAEANAAARRFELLGREFEAREILRQQKEAELLAQPPDGELAEIERRDELAQVAFDREVDRRQRAAQLAEAESQRRDQLHQAELKRIAERTKAQQQALSASQGFLSIGAQFGKAITDAAIKDDEKRAKAQLRMNGIMAIATGALEVVRAAASFASFNFVQGALHTAAAALAFSQGGIMLSGNLPGQASAGGAAAGGATRQPVERESSPVGRTVESVPAADQQPGPRPGESAQGSGGQTVIFNIDQVNGTPDETFLENVQIGLKNTGFSLAAG
jgi:hypothetical protein